MIRKTFTILSLIGLLLSVSVCFPSRDGHSGELLWDYLFFVPTLVFGIILGLCRPLHHYRSRKRRKLGLCVKCGYDLRGSEDRCPECGTEFETT